MLILDIDVVITACLEVRGRSSDVAMLHFDGTASGDFFSGHVIGGGVDTQKKSKDGSVLLSARYMLEGKDSTGKDCRIFVENNSDENGGLTPTVVTDSAALSYLESARLTADITPTAKGVNVRIYLADT